MQGQIICQGQWNVSSLCKKDKDGAVLWALAKKRLGWEQWQKLEQKKNLKLQQQKMHAWKSNERNGAITAEVGGVIIAWGKE